MLEPLLRYPAGLTRIPVTPRKWTPTPRNLEVLAAVCALGDRKAAAGFLQISPRVVKQHMDILRIGSHAVSDGQLCWIYRDRIAPHIEDAE